MVDNVLLDLDLLSEPVHVLEGVLWPLGADELLKLPDIFLIGSHHITHVALSILELVIKEILFNSVLILIDLRFHKLLMMVIQLLSGEFAFDF